jgi:uncharacterized iron-regulated membrane protein
MKYFQLVFRFQVQDRLVNLKPHAQGETMKRFLMIFIVALFLSVIGIAAEKKVQLENLPPLVQKTIQDQVKGAELKGLTQEKENGKTVYEVETIKNRRTRDVLIDAVGAILKEF